MKDDIDDGYVSQLKIIVDLVVITKLCVMCIQTFMWNFIDTDFMGWQNDWESTEFDKNWTGKKELLLANLLLLKEAVTKTNFNEDIQ